MSSVRHPNIIHIYEGTAQIYITSCFECLLFSCFVFCNPVFENREKIVLVMEYAAGGELYDFLNDRKILQDGEARRIFRQVASAVYYCHKVKFKIQNILHSIISRDHKS